MARAVCRQAGRWEPVCRVAWPDRVGLSTWESVAFKVFLAARADLAWVMSLGWVLGHRVWAVAVCLECRAAAVDMSMSAVVALYTPARVAFGLVDRPVVGQRVALEGAWWVLPLCP